MTLTTLAQFSGVEEHLVRTFDGSVVAPVAMLVAVAVGVVHGLAPGHGKTLAAAYLVGARAGLRHALALALIVAAMHTVSVFALGLAWWVFVGTGNVGLDVATRWGQVAVAVLVLGVGARITRRRWREHGAPHAHHHVSLGGAAPWSWSGLAGIASVGGLLPSPSAFLVLTSGLLTGRVGLALVMVLAFGTGLAVTVLGTGLLTLAGRDWLDGRNGRTRAVADRLPLIGAVGVLVGGVALCAVALTGVLGGD